MTELFAKKLRGNAILPTRATQGSAGYDLYACLNAPMTIPARGHATIPTGIALALPTPEYAAFMFARSGLAVKHGLSLLNAVGVIDSDYRGELLVGIVNQFDEDYTVQPGERIAQLLFLPVALPCLTETQELPETQRGAGGFGSTGK